MRVARIPEVRRGLSSDATAIGDTVYATVIPVDDANEVVGDDIRAQARQCLSLLEDVLASAGSGLGFIAHLTMYLTEIAENRDGFNDVYREVFDGLPVPVRCAVGVAALARPEFLVELTAVAARR